MIKSDGVRTWLSVIINGLPVFITLLFLVFLNHQLGDTFLAVHDSPLFINSDKLYTQMGLLWNSNSFGSPNYIPQAINFFAYIFNFLYLNLFISIKAGQLVFYFFIITFIWYVTWHSFYQLLASLGANKPKLNSLIGSYFYTFNLFMIVSWHGGTIDSLFFCYAICPLVLLELFNFLRSDSHVTYSKSTAIAFGLCAYSGPLFLSVLIACFGSFFIITIASKHWVAIIRATQFLSLTFVVSLLFLPLFALFVFFGDPFPESIDQNQQFFFSNLGISGLFRLYFDWTMNGFWNGRFFHSYYPYFNNGLISACALGLWFFTFFSLFKSTRESKFGTFFLWLLSALVAALFLAKAIQPPFGFINQWLYNNAPFFSIFRTPDTKFGLTISCLLSFGTAYALSQISSKLVKNSILLLILLQTVPFFSAVPIIEVKTGDQFERRVNLPDGYKEISSLVNNDVSEGAIFMYPGTPYAEFDYLNGSGLNGQDILGALIIRPVIHDDGWILNHSKKLYKELIRHPGKSDFGQVSIRYILVRKDLLKQAPTSFDLEKFSLNAQLELLAQNNIGHLYRVKNTAYRPEVSFADFKKNLITYRKFNSTFYRIDGSNIGSEQIILSQSYHSGWRLCPMVDHPRWIENFTSLLQMYTQLNCPSDFGRHQPYDETFNSWNISFTPPYNSQYALIFTPQAYWNFLKIFILGLIFSISMMACIRKVKKYAF